MRTGQHLAHPPSLITPILYQTTTQGRGGAKRRSFSLSFIDASHRQSTVAETCRFHLGKYLVSEPFLADKRRAYEYTLNRAKAETRCEPIDRLRLSPAVYLTNLPTLTYSSHPIAASLFFDNIASSASPNLFSLSFLIPLFLTLPVLSLLNCVFILVSAARCPASALLSCRVPSFKVQADRSSLAFPFQVPVLCFTIYIFTSTTTSILTRPHRATIPRASKASTHPYSSLTCIAPPSPTDFCILHRVPPVI